MRFAIPFAVHFLCGVTPYGLMGWNRALQAHAWTASNPRKINMWIDVGTWNIVFPNIITFRKLRFCRKSIVQAPKNCFSAHAWTASNRAWNIVCPITWWKELPRHRTRDPDALPQRAADWAMQSLAAFPKIRQSTTKIARIAKKLSWNRALQKNNFSSSEKNFGAWFFFAKPGLSEFHESSAKKKIWL